MAKKTQKKVEAEKIDKVWYAVEDFDNPEDTSIYPYESIDGAVKDWLKENPVSATEDDIYLFEIRLLGKLSIETKTTYEIKQ